MNIIREIKSIISPKKRAVIKLCKKEDNQRTREMVEWLRDNPLTVFNFGWYHDYKLDESSISEDENGRLYYLYKNHRMYFKKNMKKKQIIEYMTSLLPEQDKRSPHLYLDESEIKGSYNVVVDAGVAEGIFALDLIDIASKIILIEPDPEWVEALKRTFESYGDKVVLIEKFLGDGNNGCISIDDIIAKHGKIDLIKMDIEGAEMAALAGISEANISQISELLVCAYHYQDEEKEIRNYFSSRKNIQVNISVRQGYIYFVFDQKQTYPYVRHGVMKIDVKAIHEETRK